MVKIPQKILHLHYSEIKPYPKNARRHSEEQVNQIVDSIRLVGWGAPILIDQDNVILAGHGRFEAAAKLGMEKVPCIRLNVTKEAAKAFRLADNKIGLNSRWDSNQLRFELTALDSAGFDLSLTGFSLDELDDFQLNVAPDDNNVIRLEPASSTGRKVKVRGHTKTIDKPAGITCPECGCVFDHNK